MKINQWHRLHELCPDPTAWELFKQILNQETQHIQISSHSRVERYQRLAKAIARLRHSLTTAAVCQSAVEEIQQLLCAEKVYLFRGTPQAKDLEFQIGQKLDSPKSSLEMLQVWEVSLQVSGQDWGGIQVYHSSPWYPEEIELIQEFQEHLAAALAQAQTWEKLNQKLEQRQALARVIARLREALNLEKLFQETTREVRQLLAVDRVVIFQFDPQLTFQESVCIAEDVAPEFTALLGVKLQDWGRQTLNLLMKENLATPGLKEIQINQDLANFQAFEVVADLKAILYQGQSPWGMLCIQQCQSARDWTQSELEFVQEIADHLSVVLQQIETVKLEKAAATQIAIATERQKAVEQQKLLANTIDKIRRSLEINTIFNTATAATRQLLDCDRVAVYRFNPDWSGSFVAESFASGWKPLVGDFPIVKDTYLQVTQGGRYRENQTLAITDIYQAGHEACHIELLEQFQARAYVIVPILQGQKLWGLLAAYQNDRPRPWLEQEVELLAQIGTQFGIALQQAELLGKTKRQAEDLAQDLRQTQTQLVQSEKMSSLGQLVAGVAHEINNPVNFIYGNLAHASEYVQDLIELVQLYQTEYPDPTAAIADQQEAIDLEFLIEDLPKSLTSMQVGADRIRQLVLSLRNFSRLDEAEMKPVNVHDGIDSTLVILQYRLKAKPEHLAIELQRNYGQLPKIECYAAQLNQVFMNILSNAIDALEEEMNRNPSFRPLIKICTQLVGNWVEIIITDNGGGMPETVKARIFDPFFTTKAVGKGTGLGLSISYQIVVERHGGELQCESQPGEGTKFKIKIPVKAVKSVVS